MEVVAGVEVVGGVVQESKGGGGLVVAKVAALRGGQDLESKGFRGWGALKINID